MMNCIYYKRAMTESVKSHVVKMKNSVIVIKNVQTII